ncbi:MAG TPA: hypothetical protein VG816_00155 [Solirubrobacterales bacterium]|nr:hypothetical protein [Solirubrobacterales bacterium]
MSAGPILALTVVAVLLAGCGGGSSGSSSTTVAAGAGAESASSEAAGSGGANSGGVAEQGAGAGSTGGAAGGEGSDGSSAQASPGQSPSSGRHGPPVPMPEGEPEPGITPQQRREATVASMRLESPSVTPSSNGPALLPAQYSSCEGQHSSPALRWQGVPEGTAELVLFMMNLRPAQGTLVFDWAVAGISPKLEEIKAGQLPKGAVVGLNSLGIKHYELCSEGRGETYIFALFALPKKLSPRDGFDALALRKEVTEISGNVGLLAVTAVGG